MSKKTTSRFATPYNYTPSDMHREWRKGESMTVPDEAMSMQQIFANYSRGLPMPHQKIPSYSEEYLPDPKTLDLVDIQEISESNMETAERYKEQQEKKRKAKERASMKKQLEEQFHVEQQKKDEKNVPKNLEGK